MQLMNTSQQQTMTSREIAEVTGSDHHNMLASIRRLIKMGVISGNETPYQSLQNGMVYSEFVLNFRDTMVVASGYSVDLRAKIIDRWQQLEAGAAPALPQSFAAALRLAAEQQEQIEAQAAKISADAPKVAFAEAIRAVDGVCSIEKITKTIGIGRNKFFKMLRDDGVLMDNNLPYQKYLDREYFTVIEQEPYTDSKGETHPTFTTKVTGAGQVFLARKYSKKEKA